MKLTDNRLPAAQTSGDMVTLNMGISDNPEDQLMILNVLSVSLYTDKPAAVLREYGCNAFDANVEAGKRDVPIEVGLPNKLEPSLRIRDFGFGMTEEQIANTFVKLGKSTKRGSNDFTGMLGIGSKAGFAYGDSFMVTSFTRGRKVVYNAFRDKGAPRLAKMHEQTTTEPDGVEIKVPVRMEHFEEFRIKAERIYRYFKVRPKIAGAQVDFHDAARLVSGTGWHYTGDGKSIAVMGNVGYDLNSTGMGGYSVPQKARVLLDRGVELEFDIGDLKMTASREGLEYIDLTKKAVLARLDVLVKEIGKVFTDQITSATSLWEARKLYASLFERLGNSNVRSLKEVVDGQIKWRGEIINTGRMDLTNKEGDPEVNVYAVMSNNWTSRRQRYVNGTECYASDKTTLVINDLPNKRQSPARERGFFDDPANKEQTAWVVFTFQSDAAQARYWKARRLDGAPTILMSSITPAVSATQAGPRVAGVHNSKHSARAFVLEEAAAPNYAGARSLCWNTESVDLDTHKGSYVVLDNFYVTTPGNPLSTQENSHAFRDKMIRLRKAGLIKGPVYGFKKKALDKLGPGWVKLADEIAKNLAASLKTLAQETADYVAACQFAPVIQPEHAKEFPAGTSVRVFLDKLWALRHPKNAEAMAAVLHQKELEPWVKPITLPATSIDLAKMQQTVLKEYPILGLIPSLKHLHVNELKTVAECIRLVPPV